MGDPVRIDILRPGELGAGEHSAWAGFRAERPELASPYFDVRYALAAGETVPDARVAVIHEGGLIRGFLPFQRRGGLIQPLGAPMTDYHGPITAPGHDVDLAGVVGLIGAARMSFSGLVSGPASPDETSRPAMVADLSGGWEAYLQARRVAGQNDFLKDKRRRAGALERDHGPVDFTFGAAGVGVFDHIIRHKRVQFAETGQHDVFACGWTVDLLRRLAEHQSSDFGLRFAVLRAAGRVIAAEIGLLSGDAYHLWFPVYDPAFARYSPGALMTLETLRVTAGQGVRTVDFGAGDEPYKRCFAAPGMSVREGSISPRRPVSAPTGRLARRLDRIRACEPSLSGQIRAASKYFGVVARRHPRLSAAGVGAGLGIGLGLLAAQS